MRTNTFFTDNIKFRCRSPKVEARNFKPYGNTIYVYAEIYEIKTGKFLYGHTYEPNGISFKGLKSKLDLFAVS